MKSIVLKRNNKNVDSGICLAIESPEIVLSYTFGGMDPDIPAFSEESRMACEAAMEEVANGLLRKGQFYEIRMSIPADFGRTRTFYLVMSFSFQSHSKLKVGEWVADMEAGLWRKLMKVQS